MTSLRPLWKIDRKKLLELMKVPWARSLKLPTIAMTARKWSRMIDETEAALVIKAAE
ncbi:MAG: hypothetical protein R3D34_15870 [Nitratireductor sp.]